jgi:hypothetical protein
VVNLYSDLTGSSLIGGSGYDTVVTSDATRFIFNAHGVIATIYPYQGKRVYANGTIVYFPVCAYAISTNPRLSSGASGNGTVWFTGSGGEIVMFYPDGACRATNGDEGFVTIHSGISSVGLELAVTLPTRVPQGRNVTIVAEVNNTLSTPVRLNTTSMTNPAYGPCAQGFATKIVVYLGNYTYLQLFNNRSNPTPLLLYNPTLIYSCPAVFTFTYTFNPKSSVATIQPFIGGFQSKNETRAVRENSVVGGYWTASGQTYTFHKFQPGVYTVVIFDAWGNQKVIGYFKIV